jgi:site-specific DNA-methyltransferase (adenine-specific)
MRTVKIGDATLIHGDAREVLPKIRNIDAVVTSPPYNQLGNMPHKPTGIWGKKNSGSAWVQTWNARGYEDAKCEASYQTEQNELFSAMSNACRPTASLFYNHQLRWRSKQLLHPVAWFKPDGWNLRSEIIWDRGGGMMMNARMFCRFDERIYWFTRSSQWKWNQECVGMGTIWRIARAQHKEHPVAFPIGLPINCIKAASDKRDIILDPFMGSGTTGVAALQLGRKFIGIEIDKTYFDIAVKRIREVVKQPKPARRAA